MPRPAAASSFANRTLTILAAAFLAFDGAALLVAGIWLERPVLAIIGCCLAASSGLVFVYWRWHRRQLEEIAAARRALAADARSLRGISQLADSRIHPS